MIRSALVVTGLAIAIIPQANATVSVSASLFTPQAAAGAIVTPVSLAGVATPSSSPLSGTGFSVAFSVASGQGIVRGAAASLYAIPVGGMVGGAPAYLTGDLGSALTTNAASSGNYFSTGNGTITITFTTPQTSLALLWGSVDTFNSITFNDAANDVLTGTALGTYISGFAANGGQGLGGSAYVAATTNTTFTTVSFHSDSPSFEFQAVSASNEAFTTSVPEPVSLALLGSGIVALLATSGRRVRGA